MGEGIFHMNLLPQLTSAAENYAYVNLRRDIAMVPRDVFIVNV
jgi:hypothetical protein